MHLEAALAVRQRIMPGPGRGAAAALHGRLCGGGRGARLRPRQHLHPRRSRRWASAGRHRAVHARDAVSCAGLTAAGTIAIRRLQWLGPIRRANHRASASRRPQAVARGGRGAALRALLSRPRRGRLTRRNELLRQAGARASAARGVRDDTTTTSPAATSSCAVRSTRIISPSASRRAGGLRRCMVTPMSVRCSIGAQRRFLRSRGCVSCCADIG